jgi:hypothetical protein
VGERVTNEVIWPQIVVDEDIVSLYSTDLLIVCWEIGLSWNFDVRISGYGTLDLTSLKKPLMPV